MAQDPVEGTVPAIMRHSRSLLLFLAFALGGCVSADDGSAAPQCVDVIREPIVGGDPDLSTLGLTSAQARTIGGIELREGTLECTGVIIHPGWIVTAAHCTRSSDARFRLPAGLVEDNLVFPMRRALRHPTADLALVELTGWLNDSDMCIAPLPMQRQLLDLLAVEETTAWLAGLGSTEHGQTGELRVVEQPIVQLTNEHVIVDGQGQSGACGGDSGGPLVWRTGTGELVILGVLQDGSASCRGIDRYVRLDRHTVWIESTLCEHGINVYCG